MIYTGSSQFKMAALENTKPCVGFFKIRNYKVFDSVNSFCYYKNIDHHNDFNHRDNTFLVYLFSVEDVKRVWELTLKS